MSEVTGAPARRDMLAALGVIALTVGVVAGRWLVQRFAARPSEEQCAALLDRYLGHASRQHVPDVDDDDIDRARTDSAGKPARAADLVACQRELTAEQVACGLEAHDVDGIERCVQ